MQGRPSIYSQELAATICERIANGESLRAICRDESMPAMSTVFKHLSEHKEFSEQYARAKEESADAHADRINDIAEQVLSGELKDSQAARVALDAFKWTASKLKPKKYGDRLDLGNADDKPLVVELVKSYE